MLDYKATRLGEATMIKSANMYLYFHGNTEEAFTLYRSVFGGDFSAVVRFRDFPDNPMQIPEQELDRIAHISLPLGEAKVLQGSARTASACSGWLFTRAASNSRSAEQAREQSKAGLNEDKLGRERLAPDSRTRCTVSCPTHAREVQ